jgi:uncharacterized protein YjiS (DUF1127 family)
MTRIAGVLSLAQAQSAPIPIGLRAHPVTVIADALAHLWRGAVDELHQRKAMHELRALDARMLADVGLRPGEIETAARYGRHGLASPFPRI